MCPGYVNTLAGSGTASSVDGTGTGASFKGPFGVALDSTNQFLFVNDLDGNKIRKVNLDTRQVTTIAGTGTSGYQDGSDSVATFSAPRGLAFSSAYNKVFVADLLFVFAIVCPCELAIEPFVSSIATIRSAR